MTDAREYAKIIGITIGTVVVCSIVLAITGTIIATALGWDAALVGGSILAGAILLAAYFGYDTFSTIRWAFVERISAEIASKAANDKRVEAEAEAIKAAATRAQVVNVNSGSGTQINKSKPITYRVNGQIVNGNQLNQTNQTEIRQVEIQAADVRWFVEQLATGFPHSKSKWVGQQELPYSRLPVTYEIYKSLVDAISEAGGIVGRGERASGTLIERAPKELMKMIEASYPDAGSRGIVLELNDKPGS
jgi:hypothetical protein